MLKPTRTNSQHEFDSEYETDAQDRILLDVEELPVTRSRARKHTKTPPKKTEKKLKRIAAFEKTQSENDDADDINLFEDGIF